MSLVMALLLRFAVVVLGYVCACFAASGFLNFVTLGSLGFTLSQTGTMAARSMFLTVPLLAVLIAYFCFFPSMLVIVLAEVLGKRDWLFHALGGAVVALIFAGLMRLLDRDLGALDEPRIALLMIGGGIVGGLAYWLVSGRSAGGWRETGPQNGAPPSLPGA